MRNARDYDESMSLSRVLNLAGLLVVMIALLGSSNVAHTDLNVRVRVFTRDFEFDYLSWTLSALETKLEQIALGTTRYLPEKIRHQTALEYLRLVQQIQQGEGELAIIYADPGITDPDSASKALRDELADYYSRRAVLAPLAESILQQQLSEIVSEMELAYAGQPIPPVLYHTTPLPKALIVSPREIIRQDNNISLVTGITLDEQVALEERVDSALDVSSLVVNVGGVGVYPTMVMQTTDINWLAEVVAHEWIHNFLTLRPLGINYMTGHELRTMNETVASIAGKEIGYRLIERFYPELLPPPLPEAPAKPNTNEPPPEPPAFDFRAEMHETRLEVDRLLAEGEIEKAEAYMEERRGYFWENGYRIRKLNQAYFAFYGAYADTPVGAAGEDPVGEAVRTMRAQSPSLASFVKRLSWMSSFEQLQRALARDHGDVERGN